MTSPPDPLMPLTNTRRLKRRRLASLRPLSGNALCLGLGLTACAQQVSGSPALSPQPLPPALEREALAAAFDGLAWRLSLPVPYCVIIERGGKRSEPDSSYLASLGTTRALLPHRTCPPTYGSMVQTVDSLGRPTGPQRPPGYIDPYELTVARPVLVTSDRAAVRIHVWQGTRFWLIYCDVYLPGHRSVSCGAVEEGVS
jgi:hypothetical protein